MLPTPLTGFCESSQGLTGPLRAASATNSASAKSPDSGSGPIAARVGMEA